MVSGQDGLDFNLSMKPGEEQEDRLAYYLKQLRYTDIIRDVGPVTEHLPALRGPKRKTADLVAFSPTKANPRRIVVAESKDTRIDDAIEQLSNTAAAVLERYGRGVEIRLQIYRSGLRQFPQGLSPGPGYLVQQTSVPNEYHLLSATTHKIFPARAECKQVETLARWNATLEKLVIHVRVG